MASSTTICAEAVFDVASETSAATSVAPANRANSLWLGSHAAIPCPTAFARPVLFDNSPNAKPPPYSSTTPQSIWAACGHVRARSPAVPGSRNSNPEPTRAATPSGSAC